jgi:hypothetical protein
VGLPGRLARRAIMRFVLKPEIGPDMRHRTLPLLLALLCSAAQATDPLIWGESNSWSNFESAFDDSTKWQEVQSQLPPYPQPGNLIPIDLGPRFSNRFFIDYPSVTAGTDGAVRYVLVVKSPSGATTVSFEGMRCATGERKLYAFGHDKDKGGEWARNRNARWELIQGRSLNDIRRELFYHYFCTVDGAANLGNIQHLLKTGGKYYQD